MGDIKLLDSVQSWTKQVAGIDHLEYEKIEGFVTEGRSYFMKWIRSFKIILLWQLTKGLVATHKMKLPGFELDKEIVLSLVRVLQKLNALPERTVMQTTLSAFKRVLEVELGALLYAVL